MFFRLINCFQENLYLCTTSYDASIEFAKATGKGRHTQKILSKHHRKYEEGRFKNNISLVTLKHFHLFVQTY